MPLQWIGKSAAADRMALAGPHLFVVDGPQVWRLEPGASTAVGRRGKSFVAGRGNDEAQMVAASPDGAVLSVAVQVTGGFSWLTGVCLEACKP